MCGLAGFVDYSSERDAEAMRTTVRRITDTLTHRGPDDADYWADPASGIALGHRRLAILDLSAAGRQPMASNCGRYRIVFNGEIYNFALLRAELEKLGHAFRGHSDTEVLLAACVEWGVETALTRCVGMFAFALWDASDRILTLARDRMGEKPLYYGWAGDRFAFASEVRAFGRMPGWQGELSQEAILAYLRYGYVPSPLSVYRGIYKLPAASYLLFPTERGARQAVTPQPADTARVLQPVRYWSVRAAAEAGLESPVRDIEEAIAMLEELLGDVVTRQMVADVPLGAFLSAGIDSSAVVALMQRHSTRAVKTFTIGFDEEAFNEAHHARAIASHLGTEHTEEYFGQEEALKRVPRLASVYDEPFADSSQLPTLLVSELVRRHVTVCLTGDGGDELFGGYNRYLASQRLWNVLRPWPVTLRRVAACAIDSLPVRLLNSAGLLMQRGVPGVARGLQSTPTEKLLKMRDAMASTDHAALYRNLMSLWKAPAQLMPGISEPTAVIAADNGPANAMDAMHRTLYWDQTGYLADDQLVRVDRASMAVSLETRVPLLDHRIVEFSWRVPTTLKHREGVGKWLLRQVLYRHVPQVLMERPKMGFSVPMGQWLRGGLRSWAEALLSELALSRHGLLNPAPIRRAWSEHLAGHRNWQEPLWTVLMLQSWMEANRQSRCPSARGEPLV